MLLNMSRHYTKQCTINKKLLSFGVHRPRRCYYKKALTPAQQTGGQAVTALQKEQLCTTT